MAGCFSVEPRYISSGVPKGFYSEQDVHSYIIKVYAFKLSSFQESLFLFICGFEGRKKSLSIH